MENEENQKPVSHRFPQPLEIPNDAIPTFPQPRRGAEKWKTKLQVSHFPACCLFFSERRPGARFAPLQAHRSIRKCSEYLLPSAPGSRTQARIADAVADEAARRVGTMA